MSTVTKILLGVVLLAFNLSAHAQNVNGVMRVVKGDVKVKSGKTGETAKARIGSQVFPKDVIITGADSRAKVVMVDNNEINVSPDSQIEIQSYEFDPNKGKKDVLLNVIYGKVRAKVEQKYDGKTTKFQIKTPAAVAGVRGTDFMTSFDRQSQQTQIVTFEGKVEFGAPGPNNTIANAVMVAPGQTSTAAPGQAPSTPVSVPKEELNKVEKESKSEPGKDGGKDSAQNEPAADSKDKKDAKKEDGKSADKQGEKQADKQDDKKSDKQADKQADKQSDKQADKQADRQDDKKSDKQAEKQPDKQPDKQAGKQPDKQPDRQGGGSSASNGGSANGSPRGPASVGGGGAAPGGGNVAGGAGPGGGPGMSGAGPSASPAMGGGSMLRPEDFAGNSGAPTMPTMMDPTAGIGNMMPPTFMPGTMPVCDICTRLIENNSSKLTITIKTQ
jgi:hypothetical protein